MEYLNHQIHQDNENNAETSYGRPRWTPKQEQVVILESIYNSGVVNPPKDETTRIRKLLEDYGPVVDANVFYWFQNRRSRSRRRSRQIQAKISREQIAHEPTGARNTEYQNSSNSRTVMPSGEQDFCSSASFSYSGGGHYSSSSDPSVYDNNSILNNPGQVYYPGNESFSGIFPSDNTGPADTSHVHYQSAGFITVFINEVATEVPVGPLDMRGMFGEQDLVLFHSSGIQVSNTSFSSTLQHGESYFLVPRAT